MSLVRNLYFSENKFLVRKAYYLSPFHRTEYNASASRWYFGFSFSQILIKIQRKLWIISEATICSNGMKFISDIMQIDGHE